MWSDESNDSNESDESDEAGESDESDESDDSRPILSKYREWSMKLKSLSYTRLALGKQSSRSGYIVAPMKTVKEALESDVPGHRGLQERYTREDLKYNLSKHFVFLVGESKD